MSEFTDKSKLTTNVGAFVALIMVIISCTAAVVNTLNKFSNAMVDVKKTMWRVDDQVDFASELKEANETLHVPNPKSIMRRRVASDSDKANP
jgi:uncharacterized protein YoxC